MWIINYDYLDFYVVCLVFLFYVGYVFKFVCSGIVNFFFNLDEFVSMVNNLLMGNGIKVVDYFNCFWINISFGLFGLIDIVFEVGIKKYDDKVFSDVVGYYGVGNGFYLMVLGYGFYMVCEVIDVVDGMYFLFVYFNIWVGVGKWVFEGMEMCVVLVL